jgi:hypothetical protein
MSTQYRLVQWGKTASGGCSAGQGSSEPVAPRIYFFYLFFYVAFKVTNAQMSTISNKFIPPTPLYLIVSHILLFPEST